MTADLVVSINSVRLLLLLLKTDTHNCSCTVSLEKMFSIKITGVLRFYKKIEQKLYLIGAIKTNEALCPERSRGGFKKKVC